MKKLFFVLAAVLAVAIVPASVAATPENPQNSNTVKVTESNYQGFIATDKLVILDFWAPWCGPCRAIAPILEQLAAEYQGKIVVGKCNVDENGTLTNNFGVRGIPAIFFIKNGKVVDEQIGYCAKDFMKEKIDKLLK